MYTRIHLAMLTAMLFFLPAIEPAGSRTRAREEAAPRPAAREAGPSRAMLIEARNLAYDANFRNDRSGLQSAIAAIAPLSGKAEVASYAHYYLAWTYWMLVASQIDEKDMTGARESAARALEHARAGLSTRAGDSEFQTMLANALVANGMLDRARFKELWAELATARKKALALGPRNPRAVIMDAGIIYWAPPDQGGGREKGLSRWDQAERLLEAEANVPSDDPLAPRWGYALYHGWSANLYLSMTPPLTTRAKRSADAALALRPDFWYVRERVLPKLRE
jgi:hypothetical protein